ncbi:MAG TPA: hypothetical protein VGL62_16600 [Vicinamibacterales bacterium]
MILDGTDPALADSGGPVKRVERRKLPRDTDHYRETTNYAARIIDESKRIRGEMGRGVPSAAEIRAVRRILKTQALWQSGHGSAGTAADGKLSWYILFRCALTEQSMK